MLHYLFPGALFVLVATTPAFAACTVLNTLTNGQVADASEVMDNFDAVADCADAVAQSAVTKTGTPQTGAIATFSGPQSIAGSDLSGDVTTSGSTATTLSATGVQAGSYTNASITVDAKGRLTSATSGALGGGGGGTMTRFTVVNSTDAFIDVKLDTDDGYAYKVILRGYPTADASIGFRLSSDNGTSFYSGASDYKYGSSGASGSINLVNGSTIGSNRETIVDFTVAGMNQVSASKVALTGSAFSVTSSPSNVNAAIGGHNNALAANDFNAFRIFVSAGNMSGFAVYVQKLY